MMTLSITPEQAEVLKGALERDLKTQAWTIHQHGSDEAPHIEAARIELVEQVLLVKLSGSMDSPGHGETCSLCGQLFKP